MPLKLLTLISCLTLLLQTGCAGGKPNKAAPRQMNRVAVVGLTLDRVGTGPGNEGVLNNAADFAELVYRQELATIPDWTVVAAPEIRELDAQLDELAGSPIATGKLLELAEQQKISGDFDNALLAQLAFASLTGNQKLLEELQGKVLAKTLQRLQAELDTQRGKLVWPHGKAGIPYGLINNRSQVTETELALREITIALLEDYRKKHLLDGVVIVNLASQVGTPGDIRIITQGDRVLSSIKVNPTLVVRGPEGAIAMEEGTSRLDDLAPWELGVPIYLGDKPQRGPIENLRLDLNDPAGKGIAAYNTLIDRTAKDLVKDVVKTLQSP
jgi:hypothetical protein